MVLANSVRKRECPALVLSKRTLSEGIFGTSLDMNINNSHLFESISGTHIVKESLKLD